MIVERRDMGYIGSNSNGVVTGQAQCGKNPIRPVYQVRGCLLPQRGRKLDYRTPSRDIGLTVQG